MVRSRAGSRVPERRRDGERRGPAVIAIEGAGRSGSTLLDRLLGATPGVFGAGELRFLWKDCLLGNRRCACGRPVSACEVWSEVLATAFGSADPRRMDPHPREVVALQERIARYRRTPWLVALVLGLPDPRRPLVDRYLGIRARLYDAVAAVTGCDTVVDSSKHPPDTVLLALMPEVSAVIVRLTRDPLDVAASWRWPKPDPDTGAMIQLPAWRSSVDWTYRTVVSTVASAVNARAGHVLLRYEDLVEEPQAHLTRILHRAGMDGPDALTGPAGASRAVELPRNHTVGGNPDRFSDGRTFIDRRPPAVELTPWERLCVEVITFPWRHLSRYPVAPRSEPSPPGTAPAAPVRVDGDGTRRAPDPTGPVPSAIAGR